MLLSVPFQPSDGLSLEDFLTLVNGDVHQLATECCVDGQGLSPRRLDVAEEVTFGVGGTNSRLCATHDTCIAGNLEEDLSVGRCCDGVGLGVLEGGEFLDGELGACCCLQLGVLCLL